MTDARIGRLVAATLHEAIAECLPQRLEFYEHWLNSEALRDGSVGLAPLTAVIGFLRTEEHGYDAVMRRAGELAAAWSAADLTATRHRMLGWLPRPFRARAVLRLAARVVREVSSASRASIRVRGNWARLDVTRSLFCDVREAQSMPLCTYYMAIVIELLRRFGIDASGRVERCHASGAGSCQVVLQFHQSTSVEPPAIAA